MQNEKGQKEHDANPKMFDVKCVVYCIYYELLIQQH